MALLEGFKHDIFISYASNDDVDYLDGELGWVSVFVDCLEKELNDQLAAEMRDTGRAIDIYFDNKKIEIARHKDEQLEESVKNSAIIVLFMSGHYLASENCLNEQRWFLEALDGGRTLQGLSESDDLSPAFVVALSGSELKQWPQRLQETIYLKCYRKKESGEIPRLCHPNIHKKHPDWNQLSENIGKLAKDLAKKLRLGLSSVPLKAQQRDLDGRKILLIGTEDLDDSMDQCRAQLTLRGAQVNMPAFKDYTSLLNDLENKVRGSEAVVLMFGEFPTAAATSVLERALVASQQFKRKIFPWTESMEDLDRLFKKDKWRAYQDLVERAGVRDCPKDIEALAEQISNHFLSPEESLEDNDQQITIDLFIDADIADQDIAKQIQRVLGEPRAKKRLADQKIDVIFTYQTAALSQKEHHKWLNEMQRDSDGVAIVNGRIDPMSLKAKVRQFRKDAVGRGRKRDGRVRVSVHNAPPPTPISISWDGVRILDLNSSDYPEQFVDFVTDLAEGKKILQDR